MIQIKNLHCHVRVRTGRAASPLQGREAPQRPSLTFAVPGVGNVADAVAFSPKEAQEETNASPATSHSADPRAVADRVYELMQKEVRLGRLRAGNSN